MTKSKMLTAAIAMLSNIPAANAAHNPDFTIEANQKLRETERAKVTDAARSIMQPIVESTRQTQAKAQEEVNKNILGDQTTDALTARKFAWDRLLPILESGRKLTDMIDTADEGTARAIAEWAPAWLSAQEAASTSGEIFPAPLSDRSWIQDAVINRLATIGIDPTPYTKLLEAREAQAEVEPYYAVLLEVEAGANNMGIGTRMRLFQADPEGAAKLQAAGDARQFRGHSL